MNTPRFIEPMAAELVQELPEGDDWLYEVKWDGYRALLIKDGARLQIRSRNNNDLTAAYPTVRDAARRLHADRAVIDGELVAIGPDGLPSFQALQHRSARDTHTIAFYAFDLLHLDGEDLTARPLSERKALLEPVIAGTGLLLSAPLPGSAAQVIAAVRQIGLEGVVAKRRSSRYHAGIRAHAWRKLKLELQQEFVIGGYRPGSHGVDALLIGYYEGTALKFAAKVRAGFTPHLRREVVEQLKPLHSPRCPFADLPTPTPMRWGGGVTAAQMAEMRWVRPSLAAQVRFVEWTDDGHLRHAAFIGLRRDKEVRSIRREQ